MMTLLDPLSGRLYHVHPDVLADDRLGISLQGPAEVVELAVSQLVELDPDWFCTEGDMRLLRGVPHGTSVSVRLFSHLQLECESDENPALVRCLMPPALVVIHNDYDLSLLEDDSLAKPPAQDEDEDEDDIPF